jgi:hypothetical protein
MPPVKVVQTANHPAKYSRPILTKFTEIIQNYKIKTVLDPMAGTGRIHELPAQTVGIELEPEWAAYHPDTIVGDCMDVAKILDNESFDAIMVSPTWGNRMADHHNAKDDSKRNTYKHQLGRDPSPGSSCVMQFGTDYKLFHAKAWMACLKVLRRRGYFVINTKDFIRDGEVIPVHQWHIATLELLDLNLLEEYFIPTPGLREGANHNLRVEGEWVSVLQK